MFALCLWVAHIAETCVTVSQYIFFSLSLSTHTRRLLTCACVYGEDGRLPPSDQPPYLTYLTYLTVAGLGQRVLTRTHRAGDAER